MKEQFLSTKKYSQTIIVEGTNKMDLLLRAVFVLAVFLVPFTIVGDAPLAARLLLEHSSFYSIYPLILFSVMLGALQIKETVAGGYLI